MMTKTTMLYARAGAAAIAAAVALSPTYAASPKPIVDLSQSPAISGKPDAASATNGAKEKPNPFNGPFDERTLEFGGGALALLALGGASAALISRRRRRRDAEAWDYDALNAEPQAQKGEPLTLSDKVEEQPTIVAPDALAFARTDEGRRETAASDCSELETWVERARCGPTADNPSQSLQKRLKRAAFFDKREREVAEGTAEPIDTDAGLPESLDEMEHRSQAA